MSHRRCFSRGETWKMQRFSETTLGRFGGFKREGIEVVKINWKEKG